MDNKLIPMTDFVFKNKISFDKQGAVTLARYAHKINNYAEFLKQRLTLGMFFPVDKDGNVLENPFYEKGRPAKGIWEKYKEAKENVLFGGFFTQNGNQEVDKYTTYLVHKETKAVFGIKKEWKDEWDFEGETIEDLTKYDLTLTPSALKQIGIKE